MYADSFGLRELPFNNTPDPRFFYATPDHEEALASLVYAVTGRKGFVLLTGEAGTGKTLVARLMLRRLGTGITFANITHSVGGARDLMESICAELELKVPDRATLTQLTRVLHDFLLARFAQNIPVVLVLDEAQNLPIEALEQLRMIGNLEADDAKLLQVAIVGQPELQALFASPALRQLHQRVFRSFHLPALDRDTAAAYMAHRLQVAGGDGRTIFTDDAVDRIHEVSHGLPRIINTTCDNALLAAYSEDRAIIDGPFVETVCEQITSESLCQDTTLPKPQPRWSSGPEATGNGRMLAGSLEPLIQRAEAAAIQAQTATKDLTERNDKLQVSAGTLRTVLDRMSALLTRCEQTAADMRRQQKEAEATCRKMEEQTHRSQPAADGVRRLIERTVDRKQVEHPSATAPGRAAPWKEMLHSAQDSLQQLQALAWRTAAPPATRTPDPGASTKPADSNNQSGRTVSAVPLREAAGIQPLTRNER